MVLNFSRPIWLKTRPRPKVVRRDQDQDRRLQDQDPKSQDQDQDLECQDQDLKKVSDRLEKRPVSRRYIPNKYWYTDLYLNTIYIMRFRAQMHCLKLL